MQDKVKSEVLSIFRSVQLLSKVHPSYIRLKRWKKYVMRALISRLLRNGMLLLIALKYIRKNTGIRKRKAARITQA